MAKRKIKPVQDEDLIVIPEDPVESAPVQHRQIDRLVIHHSASPRAVTVEQIEAWHRERGFDGIGYHSFIDERGVLYGGRPTARPGAHAKGHNATSIGLCIAGNNSHPAHKWLDVQIQALVRYARWFRLFHPSGEICGHRDLPGAATECPGLDVRALLLKHGVA